MGDKVIDLERKKLEYKDPERPFIGTLAEVPYYMVDNEYIWTGYRIGFNTKRKILRTLFMVHNESINVWSHLLGAFFFLCLILYTFYYMAPPGLHHHDHLL